MSDAVVTLAGVNPDFGRVIYNLRLKHDVSQRNLAKAAGVDRASLMRLEGGTSRGNTITVGKLLTALGYGVETRLVRFGGLPESKKFGGGSCFVHSSARRKSYEVTA